MYLLYSSREPFNSIVTYLNSAVRSLTFCRCWFFFSAPYYLQVDITNSNSCASSIYFFLFRCFDLFYISYYSYLIHNLPYLLQLFVGSFAHGSHLLKLHVGAIDGIAYLNDHFRHQSGGEYPRLLRSLPNLYEIRLDQLAYHPTSVNSALTMFSFRIW